MTISPAFLMPADLSQVLSDYDVPPDQGDGTILPPPSRVVSPLDEFRASVAKPLPTRPPFPGVFQQGATGRKVTAIQRAMMREGIRTHEPNGRFDARTRWGVRQHQHQQGRPVTGIVDHMTWRKWNYPEPDGHSLFDAYGYWLVTHPRAKIAPAPATERDRIVQTAFYYYYRAAQIHYLQQRPMVGEKVCPPSLDTSCDCSEFAISCYWCGTKGRVDPSGQGFDSLGNTYTMLDHGRETSNPLPGDLVLYSNPGHVTIVVAWPMVISHGSEGGPYHLPYNYRSDVQSIRTYL